MTRIPFKIDSNHGHEISGLLFIEDEFLVFEVQMRRWSLYKEPKETVKAELAVIEHIRFAAGFFSDKIFIVPKRSALLEAIPGDHDGELKLNVAKRYRDAAADFVTTVLRRKQALQVR